MIKLSENRVALMNLKFTINALDELNILIKYYSEDKLGPAYCTFRHTDTGEFDVQIDRKIMLPALQAQRQVLIDYLSTLGIEV